MVIDIKMCRFDNVPWGFRLVGGADYEYPLTVVKVTEGSIAEEAGLRVDDVIVRINDTAATPLKHDEAHRLILSSGSVFYFGVHREQEEEVYEGPRRFPVSSSSLTKSPGQSPLSASELSLPSLTEATKALVPDVEEEDRREQEQVEVVRKAEAEAVAQAELKCRRAMTQEMHSADCNVGQHEEQQGKEEHQLVPMDSLYLPDLPDRPCSAMSEQSEIKLVEEEIAAVLSGESEVLKEHNVLGIFPKPGVCMTSDVLRSLNEEVTKTKLEKEKENRKWSTFLQRPDRPVPKSKQQLEAELRAANAYKVKIVKSAPRDKSPMPETKPAPKEATPPPPTESKEQEAAVEELQVKPVEEEEPLPTDSEVPNLVQLPDNGSGSQDMPEDAETEVETETDGEQLEKADASKEEQRQEAEGEGESEEVAAAEPNEVATPPKTDEELALEKQLSDVQKQLAALSSLPSTIQSTLDAVTKQLAELLPTFKLQQQQQQQEQQLPQIDEQDEKDEGKRAEQQLATGENEGSCVAATDVARSAACENNENKCDANDLEVEEFSHSNGDNRELELELELQLERDEHLIEQQTFRKQKHNVRFQE
ncbi:titin homolog isoform X2 [Drosophila innubila]|uniref:titin homolog isoform X2 n=1 Tax=Drosophila innubila TaxID=198719 RepID=UPI00148C2B0B|nr:titin homolog isoform X2 [Drosophila innubila]